MGYGDVLKFAETKSIDEVNTYVSTGCWSLLHMSAGQTETGAPCTLYTLGWYGPGDPEFPTEAEIASEFPLGKEH